MEKKIEKYVKAHKEAYEVWPNGEVKDYWTDKYGITRIEYENGKSWYYHTKNGQVEWW